MLSAEDERLARAEELASHIENYAADPISYPSSTTTTSSTTITTGAGRASFPMELVPGHPLVNEVISFLDWLPPDEVCTDEVGGKYFRHDPENCWYRLVNNSKAVATAGSTWFTKYADGLAQWLRSHFGGDSNDLAKNDVANSYVGISGTAERCGQNSKLASRKERRMEWLAKAMLLVREHPEWPNAKIAQNVGVDPAQLTKKRCPEFHAAAALARDGTPRRGHVTFDRDSRTSDVEAYDEDDPAQRDWD